MMTPCQVTKGIEIYFKNTLSIDSYLLLTPRGGNALRRFHPGKIYGVTAIDSNSAKIAITKIYRDIILPQQYLSSI